MPADSLWTVITRGTPGGPGCLPFHEPTRTDAAEHPGPSPQIVPGLVPASHAGWGRERASACRATYVQQRTAIRGYARSPAVTHGDSRSAAGNDKAPGQTVFDL